MRVALVSPVTLGADSNPGWYMITAGIQALVRKLVPDVSFVMVDMLQDNPIHWAAAATCDKVILCGNPRFTLSDDAWWEGGIWYRLAALQAAGIDVIDGWAGAAYSVGDTPLEVMVEDIATKPRNVEFLQYAKMIHARITRDELMSAIYAWVGASHVQLPCSSWWAKDTMVVENRMRLGNAIVLVPLQNRHWMADAIRAHADRMQAKLVACTWGDYLWAKGVGLDAELVNDPQSLMTLYSRCQDVLSFRVHASIPAASVGCRVHTVAIDTRATLCQEFNLPVSSIHAFRPDADLQFATAYRPDEDHVLTTLKEMLCL